MFAEPEVVIKQLTADHPFLVIASDGVWEFLTSQSVIDMVGVRQGGRQQQRGRQQRERRGRQQREQRGRQQREQRGRQQRGGNGRARQCTSAQALPFSITLAPDPSFKL